MIAPLYRCRGSCGRELPHTSEFFYRQQAGVHGLGSTCKTCWTARYPHKRRRLAKQVGASRSPWRAEKNAAKALPHKPESTDELAALSTRLDEVVELHDALGTRAVRDARDRLDSSIVSRLWDDE